MAAAYQLNIRVSDRTIDSHIRNIRAKLAAENCDNVIETIHGIGFKLGRCEPQANRRMNGKVQGEMATVAFD